MIFSMFLDVPETSESESLDTAEVSRTIQEEMIIWYDNWKDILYVWFIAIS